MLGYFLITGLIAGLIFTARGWYLHVDSHRFEKRGGLELGMGVVFLFVTWMVFFIAMCIEVLM